MQDKKKTKSIKVRDLKPKKDAKGGASRHNLDHSFNHQQSVNQGRNQGVNQSHSEG
jgi:hypothetical protein